MPNILIVGASSGIGLGLLTLYKESGCKVTASSSNLKFLKNVSNDLNVEPTFYFCDLKQKRTWATFFENLKKDSRLNFNILVISLGTLIPIGPISTLNFDEVRDSFNFNFFFPLEFVRDLLNFIDQEDSKTIVFFGGGGINSAFTNHASYSISKLSLLKAVEILDSEYIQHNFICIGPGYVKTKIHDQSLQAGPNKSGANYVKVKSLLKSEGTPISQIKKCIDWCHESGKNIVGGRNISVTNEDWQTFGIESKLMNDKDLWKIRRKGL